MKREINFRVWDIKNRIMFSPDTIPNFINDPIKETGFIYMQYTGLNDKNNNRIYEGDIVKADKNIKYGSHYVYLDAGNYSVRYYANCWRLSKWNQTKQPLNIHIGVWREVEIIGNIYEHIELL